MCMAKLSLWMVATLVSVVGSARRSLAWSSGPRAVQLMPAQGALAVESKGSTATARSRYKVEQPHIYSDFNGLKVRQCSIQHVGCRSCIFVAENGVCQRIYVYYAFNVSRYSHHSTVRLCGTYLQDILISSTSKI